MAWKKDKKADKAAPASKAKVAAAPKKEKQSKQPKTPKVNPPMDIYTVLLGLSALFLIAATVVLGLNYYWYQSTTPPVIPINWK